MKARIKMFSDLREEQQNIIRDLTNKNNELQKRFNDYQDRKIEENANLMKRLDIADKKLTVFSRELEQANKEIKKLIEINHELAEEHKTIGQDLYAEIKNYRKEKENLKEENERLKKTLQELEDLSLKTYDVADFQIYFDNLRGKNND